MGKRKILAKIFLNGQEVYWTQRYTNMSRNKIIKSVKKEFFEENKVKVALMTLEEDL